MSKINIKLFLFFILAAALIGYLLYQARGYLIGPEITIDSPQAGEIVHDSYLEIKGSAFNVAGLLLNGRQIFTDEKGNFKEGLLLAKGYNIIELTATDKFGRVKKEKREVIFE